VGGGGKPTDIALPHLTEGETTLYRDLVEDRYGHHVRLEQERISYACVLSALH
jgi:Wadjet protein JetD, C-terminal